MNIDIRLPELGEQIKGGDVVAVRVRVGDRVAVDDVLLELETDKAIVEIPATAAGTVAKIHVAEGDYVHVGQVLVSLTAGDASASTSADASAAGAAATDAATQAKTTATPPAATAASVPSSPPATGAEPPVHAVTKLPTPAPEATLPSAASAQSASGSAPAAPSVRKLARELGIDIERVPPGRDGHIHAEDVKAYVRAQLSGGAAPAAVAAATTTPVSDEPRRESMSKIRRATARQMTLAWNTIPHVTHYDEADITDLERQRKALAADVEAAGGKLTLTAILLKLLGDVLPRHPKLTATIDIDTDTILYHDVAHIGVAVDTPGGLLVPVIRDVGTKSLLDLAIELNATSARARAGKVALSELSGATFTVTNLGGIGGTGFSPLINPPGVAILGVARGRIQPRFIDGEFVPRLVMPFSLSYDHRLIDGADAARFCRDLAEALETPLRLLLRAP